MNARRWAFAVAPVAAAAGFGAAPYFGWAIFATALNIAVSDPAGTAAPWQV